MTVTLYGIKTCDTVAKARRWLDTAGIAYRFHDFRIDGLDPARLDAWVAKLGWEKLLNKSSTTFRALAPEDREGLDAAKAIRLMREAPTMIKRPVLDRGGRYEVGFKPEAYAAIFGRAR